VGEDRHAAVRRTTVAEAAEILGISAEAVRGRVRRGTLPVEREGGTVYVLIDQAPYERTTTDQSRTTDDQTAALIASLQDQIQYLREQLDAEREARTEERRRHDTLMAQLTSRIPELEPPAPPEAPEPREEPERPLVRPERIDPERAEPVDPERVEPERVPPERVEPRESDVSPGPRDAPPGPSEAPREEATERPFTEGEPERRPWWRRLLGE
jgi:hypothetical protein